MLGQLWLGVLVKMADEIRSCGADPFIDPQALGGAIVLALDDILPERLNVTPRVAAIGGSSAILAQRFLLRKQIGQRPTLRSVPMPEPLPTPAAKPEPTKDVAAPQPSTTEPATEPTPIVFVVPGSSESSGPIV